MAANSASIDPNGKPTLIAVSSTDGTTIIPLYANPTTHRLLVDLIGGGSLTLETPVGAVNGSNTSFTVSKSLLVLLDKYQSQTTEQAHILLLS